MSIRVNGKVIASNGDVKTETDNLVTTDTNQTITAEKTFTTQLPILIERDVNQQQIPTASVAGQIVLLKNKTYTKGDGSSGWVQCVRSSTGDTTSSIAVRRFLDSDSEEITNDIGVTVAPNGVSYAYTSRQTPNEAPDNAIVTKGYVDSKSGGLELLDITFAPLGIDESKNKRRYLNGQVLIQEQFPAFTAAVKARMATMANAFTTETNWQAEKTNSKLGQCGKFVVDDTAGTIRLPCVVNAQGLVDLTMIGGIKSESLPNITGSFNAETYSAESSGAMYVIGDITTGQTSASASGGRKYGFDASRSSSTYQDNAPVQQEAVQYPYCIQVATGVEETLPAIREYQINTPFFFGQSMYSDVAPDNASWLVSNGQYNAKTVYPDYYDWLVEQMNAGVSGFVASTAAYTDYDFVVNATDQTFRLPLKNGQEGVFADNTVPSGWNLYYYVGDTVQDASLINAGAVLGQLANVNAASRGYVVDSYHNGTEWYRIYSDGWIEQGGVLTNRTENVTTFNLLVPYNNTNFTGTAGVCTAAAMNNGYSGSIYGINSIAPVSGSQACTRTVGWSDTSWAAWGYRS